MSDSDSTAMAAEFSDVEGVEEAQDDDGVEKAQVHGMVEGEKATTSGKKKWRVPQDLIDFILAWDVSDYVFPTPDNMDMPISEESKARYCANRKRVVATVQDRRRTQRKMQDWVNTELEKRGYVEIETTAEMLEKHQLE